MNGGLLVSRAAGDPARRHPPQFPDRQRSSRRAYDMLRAYLREIQPGQRLQDFQVASLFNTSRASIRDAMHALVEEGLLVRAPRVGTTLVGQMMKVPLDALTATSLVDEHGRPRVSCTRLTQKIIPAAPYVQARLGSDSPTVQLLETLACLDGTPVSVREAYFSAAIPRESITDEIEDLDSIIERVFGDAVGDIENTIESIPCSDKTAVTLGIPAGSPLLLRETLMYGVSGAPLMLNFTQYRGDRVSLGSTTSRRSS